MKMKIRKILNGKDAAEIESERDGREEENIKYLENTLRPNPNMKNYEQRNEVSTRAK